jgi:acid phosphatase
MARTIRWFLLAVAVATVAGCASRPAARPAATPAVEAAALPDGLRWYLTSAERRALVEQTFRIASERILAQAAGRQPGTWAVIADADETLLDNSEYQLLLARRGERFAEPAWQAWARLGRARAQPGSRKFVEAIAGAGGRVVVVTNRAEPICDATRANFASLGLAVAAILCAPVDAKGNPISDKKPRFLAVTTGSPPSSLPPLEVLAYIGDNIKDFPDRSQGRPEPLADFGQRFFVLPNPMYGSWEANEVPAETPTR